MDFVKMIDSFIPALDYCSMSIEFVDSDHENIFNIFLFRSKDNGKYFLCVNDQEIFFQTGEELADRAKSYLDQGDVSEVEISGLSMPGTLIYKKK
jgi:hypothetical protein